MSQKITELKWHLVDNPYNFYKFSIEVNSRHVHTAQVTRKAIDETGLTPPEAVAKLLRMQLDASPVQQRTRTFND